MNEDDLRVCCLVQIFAHLTLSVVAHYKLPTINNSRSFASMSDDLLPAMYMRLSEDARLRIPHSPRGPGLRWYAIRGVRSSAGDASRWDASLPPQGRLMIASVYCTEPLAVLSVIPRSGRRLLSAVAGKNAGEPDDEPTFIPR